MILFILLVYCRTNGAQLCPYAIEHGNEFGLCELGVNIIYQVSVVLGFVYNFLPRLDVCVQPLLCGSDAEQKTIPGKISKIRGVWCDAVLVS